LVEEEPQKNANERPLEDLLENLDLATETGQHEPNTISLRAIEDIFRPQATIQNQNESAPDCISLRATINPYGP
jgi:hypothetical protein